MGFRGMSFWCICECLDGQKANFWKTIRSMCRPMKVISQHMQATHEPERTCVKNATHVPTCKSYVSTHKQKKSSMDHLCRHIDYFFA